MRFDAGCTGFQCPAYFHVKVEVFFKWNLIREDYDDNKFVDCAIAANVRFVVTEDRHFGELRNIEFPQMEVIGVEEFLAEVKKLGGGKRLFRAMNTSVCLAY